MADTRLELAREPRRSNPERGRVPPPLPPDDPEAWYAPAVRSQYEVHPGVVVTISRRATDFAYRVRDPVLTDRDAARLERVRPHVAAATDGRPRTREGTAEALAEGLDAETERTVERIARPSPASGRRLRYHALAAVAGLGELTPHALDDRIEVADATGESLVVHTDDYAPAVTGRSPDPEVLRRFASRRVDRRLVTAFGVDVPVVRYRENLLGGDPFVTKYAVSEPELRPGDARLVEACARRLRQTDVDDPERAMDVARGFAARAVGPPRGTSAIRTLRAWLRRGLATLGLRDGPADRPAAEDRIEAVAYHACRETVGEGPLTVPLRDAAVERIEVNRVGERIKVVTDAGDGSQRVPSNLSFEDPQAADAVVERLATAGSGTPAGDGSVATVTVDRPGVPASVRCTLARSADGEPAIAVRKRPGAVTVVDVVDAGTPATLVALCWLCLEHRGAVLIAGPDEGAAIALLNAFLALVPADDRPVSVACRPGEVRQPHETGTSLTPGDGGASIADLVHDADRLDPDVVAVAGIETGAAIRAVASHLSAGRGLLGTTRARDARVVIERALARGVAPSIVREIDLVVVPRRVEGGLVLDRVVEVVDPSAIPDRADDDSGVVEAGGAAVGWNVLARRTDDGLTVSEDVPTAEADGDLATLAGIAAASDRPVEDVRAECRRKRRYLRYLVREGVDEGELFGLLADLATNEAATVERLNRHAAPPRGPDASGQDRADVGDEDRSP